MGNFRLYSKCVCLQRLIYTIGIFWWVDNSQGIDGFLMNFPDIFTVIFPSFCFYICPFSLIKSSPLFFHFSPSDHLFPVTPLSITPPHHKCSHFTFLANGVTSGCVLTSEDLELGIFCEKEHAMSLFLDLGYLTQYDLF